ncbi:MAG: phosphatidate cytidylyltransferase [Candidatus Omnitrophica bacterium]|nr:phosphatidate cytidylyltransferase [Candidatus Omnitrophota bacterium]
MESNIFFKRAISSLVLIAAFYLIIYVAPVPLFMFIGMVFIFLALREYIGMVERKGIEIVRWPVFVMGLLYPLVAFLRRGQYENLLNLYFIALFYLLFIAHALKKKSDFALLSLAASIFGFVYISWCLSFLIAIRLLPNGKHLVLFILLVSKMGDVGAYIIGSKFGTRQLIKHISPKKSVEGAVGGLLFSVVAAMLCKVLLSGIHIVHLIGLGLGLGILAQSGDLVESLLKRDCGLKDSGALVPGIGGALDLIDSVLFGAPIFYLYCYSLL